MGFSEDADGDDNEDNQDEECWTHSNAYEAAVGGGSYGYGLQKGTGSESVFSEDTSSVFGNDPHYF